MAEITNAVCKRRTPQKLEGEMGGRNWFWGKEAEKTKRTDGHIG